MNVVTEINAIVGQMAREQSHQRAWERGYMAATVESAEFLWASRPWWVPQFIWARFVAQAAKRQALVMGIGEDLL